MARYLVGVWGRFRKRVTIFVVQFVHLFPFLSGEQERYPGSTEDKASFLYDTITFCSPCKVCSVNLL